MKQQKYGTVARPWYYSGLSVNALLQQTMQSPELQGESSAAFQPDFHDCIALSSCSLVWNRQLGREAARRRSLGVRSRLTRSFLFLSKGIHYSETDVHHFASEDLSVGRDGGYQGEQTLRGSAFWMRFLLFCFVLASFISEKSPWLLFCVVARRKAPCFSQLQSK